MQYTDVGEKTNTPFLVLIVFGSLSPFSGGQKRLLRRPDTFWHSLPSKETKMLQMLCCRRYCCLYNRQISAQKATSWGSLLSKFHCWENSSLVERFGTKLGLLPSYTGGTRWEGMMVQSCSGSAAKQGSLWHGALPRLHTVAATPCRTHRTQAHQHTPWSCKWVRHVLTTRERGERQRDESAQNHLQDAPVSRESTLSSSSTVQQITDLIHQATLAPWNWG